MRIALALIAALVCASASAAGPRNMNVGGQGGHLNVPLSGVVLRLPLTVSTADECSGASIPGVTFSRSSSATCTKSDGTVVTLAANQPRVTAAGLLIEGAATNYFLNSGTPATQTITLSTTGTYTGWTDAGETGGSMSLAVGTATATGLPCSTSAGSCTFTITGAGTITATVSGTPLRAQVENSAIRTSYIPTAGTSAARTADVATGGAVAITTTPSFAITYKPAEVSSSAYLLNVYNSASDRWQMNMVGGKPSCSHYDGTTNNVLTYSTALTAGTSYRLSCSYDGAALQICVNSTCESSAKAITPPSTTFSSVAIGRYGPSGTSTATGSFQNICVGRTPGACQ